MSSLPGSDMLPRFASPAPSTFVGGNFLEGSGLSLGEGLIGMVTTMEVDMALVVKEVR